MSCYDVGEFTVYILSPIDVIPIRWISQSWEKSKLQMVVSVDKARHDQEAAKINFCAVRLNGPRKWRVIQDTTNAAAGDLDRSVTASLRPFGVTSSMDNYLLFVLFIKTWRINAHTVSFRAA
jgi:hypothetical protein